MVMETRNVTSTVSIFMFSLLGSILHIPLFLTGATLSTLTTDYARAVTLLPCALVLIASTIVLVCTLKQYPSVMLIGIVLGFLAWPIAAVTYAGISVGALWGLSCQYSSIFTTCKPRVQYVCAIVSSR